MGMGMAVVSEDDVESLSEPDVPPFFSDVWLIDTLAGWLTTLRIMAPRHSLLHYLMAKIDHLVMAVLRGCWILDAERRETTAASDDELGAGPHPGDGSRRHIDISMDREQNGHAKTGFADGEGMDGCMDRRDVCTDNVQTPYTATKAKEVGRACREAGSCRFLFSFLSSH